MELCGEKVRHKTFGGGEITAFGGGHVTVLFDMNKEEKQFVYPSAFDCFLVLIDSSLGARIREDSSIALQIEAENRRVLEEAKRKEREIARVTAEIKAGKTGTSKVSTVSNIAFKCNYCDGGKELNSIGYKGVCSDSMIRHNITVAKNVWCKQPENVCNKYLHGEMTREELNSFYESTESKGINLLCYESQILSEWIARAGITQTGESKGKPMSIKRAKPNSLALLTSKLPGQEDLDRFIFAVFLIDENHFGDSTTEGFLEANEKYRLQLTLEEAKEVKFWDYYFNPNKKEKITFGSGLHRYFTDIQAAQVLKKISKIKKGTKDEGLAEDFLEYFCRIKKIDIDTIPRAQGTLNMLK